MSIASTSEKRIYFPGLNGIRALAAISVVLAHIDDYKWRLGFSASATLPKVLLSGGDAVIMFFVLSGFLITYLLMTEIQKTGTVSVRKFYIRRILRIWPIYYLLLFLGLVGLPFVVQILNYQGQFLPQASSPIQVLLYTIMLPNVAAFFGSLIPGISQMWTIGIEEQFYLLWPALTKLFAKHILTAIFGVIVIKIALNLFLNQIMDDNNFPLIFRALLGIINNLSFEYMAVGALGAYLLFHKHRLLSLIFHPIVEKLTLLFMLCNILFISSSDSPALGSLFCIPYILFILNVSCNPNSTIKLENRLFNWLGKLSYSIYMYHLMIIYIVLLVFTHINVSQWNSIVFNLVLYTTVIVLTIAAAQVSYRWYEQPFLNLKSRFMVVKSGSAQNIASDTLPLPVPDTAAS